MTPSQDAPGTRPARRAAAQRPSRSGPSQRQADPPQPLTASGPGTDEVAGMTSPGSGESRYPPRPSPKANGRSAGPNRVLRLTLTEAETVPMTAEQHQQAVSALSAMILSWLQRRAHGTDRPPPAT